MRVQPFDSSISMCPRLSAGNESDGKPQLVKQRDPWDDESVILVDILTDGVLGLSGVARMVGRAGSMGRRHGGGGWTVEAGGWNEALRDECVTKLRRLRGR